MTETLLATSQTTNGSNNCDSIGVPVPNTEMKIVDVETRTNLAHGEMGEICIRGPQVKIRYVKKIT